MKETTQTLRRWLLLLHLHGRVAVCLLASDLESCSKECCALRQQTQARHGWEQKQTINNMFVWSTSYPQKNVSCEVVHATCTSRGTQARGSRRFGTWASSQGASWGVKGESDRFESCRRTFFLPCASTWVLKIPRWHMNMNCSFVSFAETLTNQPGWLSDNLRLAWLLFSKTGKANFFFRSWTNKSEQKTVTNNLLLP